PVPGISAGVGFAPPDVIRSAALAILCATTDAHPHHRASLPLLPSPTASLNSDVLPNLFCRLWVVNALGVVAGCVADDVRALAQSPASCVVSKPNGELPDLLDQRVIFDLRHSSTPIPL